MGRTPGNFRWSITISSAPVLPFMVLDLLNRRELSGSFPFPLFGVLSALPFCFTLLLMHSLRARPAEAGGFAGRWGLLVRAVLLIVIAWL